MSATLYGADDRQFAMIPMGVVAGSYTAALPNLIVPFNLSSGSGTLVLPSAPLDRSVMGAKVVSMSGSNTLTVQTGGTDVFDVAGGVTSITLNQLDQSVMLEYSAAAGIWYQIANYTSGIVGLTPIANGGTGQSAAPTAGQSLVATSGTATKFVPGMLNVMAFGAAGNGTADDTAAINAALAAANAQGGGVVYLPWGTYLVSGTLSIPPYVTLAGQAAISLNLLTPPTSVTRILASASWAPTSTTGIISIESKTPGGWGVNTAACGLRQIMLDGSANTNTNLQGINLVGPVYDLHFEDVFVFTAPHNGITASGQTESGLSPTYPYHLRFNRVSVVSAANTGFNLVNFTDSSYVNCLAFGNGGTGFNLQNCSNSTWASCRSEWNVVGWAITGSSGTMTFTGCTTDQNGREGLAITSATGQAAQGGGIVWTGGKFHADANSGTSGHTYGIQITGSTVPIAITGALVESGENVNNSSYYPASAFGIGSSSNVTVTGAVLQGISAAWTDGGSNTAITRKGCVGATGNPGSQVFSQLIDLGPEVAPWLGGDFPTPLLAMNFDPLYAATGSAITLTDVTLIRVNVRTAMSVTNVVAYITALGATLTSGENYAGLYNSAGTRIAVTADQTTNWETGGTTGEVPMALAGGPYTLAPGFYWVALLANGTTAPSFLRMPTPFSASSANLGQSVTGSRCATNGTGTSLPSSITPSSNTNAGQIWWAGLS